MEKSERDRSAAYFSQYQAVRDVLSDHESCHQMVDGARFTAVRSKVERVQLTVASEVVERLDVGVHVVDVVDVGRVLVRRPVLRQRCIFVEAVSLGLGLVVDRIKARNLRQREVQDSPHSRQREKPTWRRAYVEKEFVQVRVRAWVVGHLEQRHEYVVDDLGKVGHHLVGSEYIARNEEKTLLISIGFGKKLRRKRKALTRFGALG